MYTKLAWIHADQVASTYAWPNVQNALMRLNKKIHDALDPNGIVSPSKPVFHFVRFFLTESVTRSRRCNLGGLGCGRRATAARAGS